MTSRRRLLQGLALTSLAPRIVAAAVPENWTQTFDVIVVGGGGAGLAASVAAAQNGASVCLIEKLPLLGGDTLRSTGYFSCVEPRRQKLNGIKDSLDLHYRQTMEAGGNLGNPKVVRKMIEEAPRTVAWLEECGVLFHDMVYEIYGSDYRRCLKPLLPRGSAYVRALSLRAMALGVKIMLETKLVDVHLNETGRAVGVLVQSNAGLVISLRANKGIVLACGGHCFGRAALCRMCCWQSAGAQNPRKTVFASRFHFDQRKR